MGLRKFIESFPSGLLTVVGEEGLKLSGGQKQLIAFIRVMVKEPDILIVDEGTSGMDRATERMIMNLLSLLKARMGILLITHRINILKKLSDYIYILEGKKITDHGKHDDLIKYDNLYKRFHDDF
jgi:ATP-binding cassette subfamily B protein